MELTYEGLQADIVRAISKQETTVHGMRDELEAEIRNIKGACCGEPYFAQEGQDYERADDYLQMLYGLSEDLDDREAQGVPLGHPRDDVFVDDLLQTID